MKKLLFFAAFVTLAGAVSCRKHQDSKTSAGEVQFNPAHPLKDGLQSIIKKYTDQGVPGLQVVVKTKTGWYAAAGGYANINDHALMKGDSTSWLFSITKTYTAALVLKEVETGKLQLDQPIKNYLPAEVAAKLNNAENITLKQLLNHSSGVVNFLELAEFRERQLSDPLNQPTNTELLQMIYDEEPLFEPGTDTHYSNTNYLLLGLILEKAANMTYEDLLHSRIIVPLHLQHTYYNINNDRVVQLGFPHYYFDANGSGGLQDGTLWNHALGNGSRYWGGIAARPSDVILFYDALVKGKVVSEASLQKMQTYFHDYGLGIEAYTFPNTSGVQFGHEGDGVGNSTMILYIPKTKSFVFIHCNVGRQLPGHFLHKIVALKNDLAAFVVKNS